jgi:cysteine synthase A
MGPVVDSVLELVGHTPLVRIRGVVPEGAARVWAKAEHLNPGGSVKDRIAVAMIEAAERDGRLAPGQPVVEPTSGNTGISLAIVCRKKGYPLVLTMPASMSLERRQLLAAYGAEIVLTPDERVMDGAIEAAHRIASERGAFMPMQFENPANPAAHARATAVEILEALGVLHAFVAGVGTGGTISGVGGVLKRSLPSVRVVAVEPDASAVLSGEAPGPSKIQGIGAGFVPKTYDASVVDAIVRVTDRDAHETKRRLAREDGLLVGVSAGANVFAAVRVAQELGEGHDVVTVLCDTGERYFSLEQHFT